MIGMKYSAVYIYIYSYILYINIYLNMSYVNNVNVKDIRYNINILYFISIYDIKYQYMIYWYTFDWCVRISIYMFVHIYTTIDIYIYIYIYRLFKKVIFGFNFSCLKMCTRHCKYQYFWWKGGFWGYIMLVHLFVFIKWGVPSMGVPQILDGFQCL